MRGGDSGGELDAHSCISEIYIKQCLVRNKNETNDMILASMTSKTPSRYQTICMALR